MRWPGSYTSFRYGNNVVIKYSRDVREAAVNTHKKRKGYTGRLLCTRSVGDNNGNANGNNHLDNNNGRLVGIGLGNAGTLSPSPMDHSLFDQICSYDNIFSAYEKACKRKKQKQYVLEFEKNLTKNLAQLQQELVLGTYKPRPLATFILRDPKTRKISKSDFRDRIVHHAICNVIMPLFEERFIHDSFANRKGKGVFKALQRFDSFKQKVSKNNTRECFVLKADIKHYFDEVDHEPLLSILKRRIPDERVLDLVRVILANHKTKEKGKGMPLGNLTSQFFANVYLHELDLFVKHELRARHYIRYVDDFVILHHSRKELQACKQQIDGFLKERLKLELHPGKSKIVLLKKGIGFLGFRVFYHHKLLCRKNIRKFERKLQDLAEQILGGGGGSKDNKPSNSSKDGSHGHQTQTRTTIDAILQENSIWPFRLSLQRIST